VHAVLVAVVVAGGAAAGGLAYAQLRDGGLLPADQAGILTATGCLVRGGKDGDKYLLANPAKGSVDSVEDSSCAADPNGDFLELQETHDVGLNDSFLNRIIEISGRLEKEESDDPDNLREFEVRTFRVVPVVPPRRAVMPAPVPQSPTIGEPPPAIGAEPAQPVATTGQEPAVLPRTASPLALIGAIGLLSMAGGIAVRRFRSRARR
jgi:hypothetical protein